ncbi:MAG: hypothetical protein ACLQOO_32925, partial [Terriglobia bacterium]
MRRERSWRCTVDRGALPACLLASIVFWPGDAGKAKDAAKLAGPSAGSIGISSPAYQELNERTAANRNSFFVYLDQDSGFNHGYASGFMPTGDNITVNTGCVDDPSSASGCSSSANVVDTGHGTVLQVILTPPNDGSGYRGLNIEEPEDWGVLGTGTGYDLTGATSVSFDVR